MTNTSVGIHDRTDGSLVDRAVAGAVGGLAGGIVMGVLLQFGTDILPVFGRLLGASTLLRGWVVHLATSVLFGVLFAAFVSLPLIADLERDTGTSVLLAVIHATALSYVTIGIVLPLATIVFGIAELPLLSEVLPGPGTANLASAAVFALGHVGYGVVLGAVYATLETPDPA